MWAKEPGRVFDDGLRATKTPRPRHGVAPPPQSRALQARERAPVRILLSLRAGGDIVTTIRTRSERERQSGKVLVPALLYLAGAPLGLVLLLWFFFFRG